MVRRCAPSLSAFLGVRHVVAPPLQLFESRTPSPAVSKTIPAKGRSCYPSGPAFVHFGSEALVEAGRWHAGRGGQAGRRRGEPATRGAAGWLGRLAGRGAAGHWRASGCGGLAGRGAAVLRADNAWFYVVENTPYLWHFAPGWSSFSVNGFAILFMNNYEYRTDMRKQLSDGYSVNNEHISTLKRYSNDLDTRDKRKERRTLHD